MKKYPLGSLVKYKTPFMDKHEIAIIVGYTDYVGVNGHTIHWLRALMSDATIQNFNHQHCKVISKFYSKYKRGNNENRKRS